MTSNLFTMLGGSSQSTTNYATKRLSEDDASFYRSATKTLRTRGWNETQIEMVLYHVCNNFSQRPSEKNLIKNFEIYLTHAKNDPISSGVVAEPRAIAVSNDLRNKGDHVPPEYVQQTINEYVQVTREIQQSRSTLWYALPHPSCFAALWYSELCPAGGDMQYRRFHKDHPAWKRWLRKNATKLGYNA